MIDTAAQLLLTALLNNLLSSFLPALYTDRPSSIPSVHLSILLIHD